MIVRRMIVRRREGKGAKRFKPVFWKA